MAVTERYRRLAQPGDCKSSFIKADHDGWLLLDGRKLTKAAYPMLFAKLGITAADLTLPDGRNRVLAIAGPDIGNPGDVGGALSTTIATDNLPAHQHDYFDAEMSLTPGKASMLTGLIDVLLKGASKDTAKKTSMAGGGQPLKLPRPPYLALNLFIFGG